ncbi:hypothetical protein C6P40_004493 [Pichia californica]|uniref:BZIP domain-containing protein n=1 Tax=Pichia californica TaxID=460514 RepID=A0A9P7BGX7_9ASCO|nr:hypothetical protein C6P42_004982 [[Candida] californica]KAG0689780.1 hypothetical protein C6P40_004493 [[Candida] californica]
MSSPISNQEMINNDNDSSSHLPPRKRARTEAEKEQRRVERIIRNRKAAHASREKKRKHVEQLEAYVKELELNLSNSIKLNNSLISNLKSNDIQIDENLSSSLSSIEQIERPNGLVLSDEDESLSSTPNDDNDDHENDKNDSIVKESDDIPVLISSSSSSPCSSITTTELTNPSTPISDDISISIDKSCKNQDFNLMLTHPSEVIDINNYIHNTYLEPEFSSDSSDLIDQQCLVFQSSINNLNSDSLMGYLGSYNSVHSAVMHISSISCFF